MYCKICGDERNTEYRPSKRQTLCRSCNADTPKKMGRLAFDQRYWGSEAADVPESIRREFYSDYLASSVGFSQYKADTTSLY